MQVTASEREGSFVLYKLRTFYYNNRMKKLVFETAEWLTVSIYILSASTVFVFPPVQHLKNKRFAVWNGSNRRNETLKNCYDEGLLCTATNIRTKSNTAKPVIKWNLQLFAPFHHPLVLSFHLFSPPTARPEFHWSCVHSKTTKQTMHAIYYRFKVHIKRNPVANP